MNRFRLGRGTEADLKFIFFLHGIGFSDVLGVLYGERIEATSQGEYWYTLYTSPSEAVDLGLRMSDVSGYSLSVQHVGDNQKIRITQNFQLGCALGGRLDLQRNESGVFCFIDKNGYVVPPQSRIFPSHIDVQSAVDELLYIHEPCAGDFIYEFMTSLRFHSRNRTSPTIPHGLPQLNWKE